jgi:5'-3' exonuclease
MTGVVKIHATSPVLAIDTSYYVFYRYFATLRWYTFQVGAETMDPEQWVKASAFRDAFFRHVQQDIKKWRKQYRIPRGNIFLCEDCRREDIWRHDILEAYKGTRVTSATFHPSIFPVFYQWVQDHGEAHGLTRLACDRLEADDVAYLLVQKCKELLPHNTVYVLTNDQDYLQMRDEQVILENAQKHPLAKKSVGTPRQDLLYKVLVGDVSDNIPSVKTKLGPKTAKALVLRSEEELQTWLEKHGCLPQYKRNYEAICFECIPDTYVRCWQSAFQFEVETE